MPLLVEEPHEGGLEVESVGAEILTSACPSCNTTFIDAVRATDSNIEVLDLVEYIAQKLNLD